MPAKINLSPESIERIKTEMLSDKMSLKEIAKSFNICVSKLQKLCKEYNIKRINPVFPKTKVNHDFFEKIDTPEKAYILGLWSADGNIYKDKRCNSRCVSLGLQESDREILDKIHLIMECEKPVKVCNKTGQLMRGKQIQNIAIIKITSNKIAYDLEKLGVTERKSLTLRFPTNNEIPDHLWKDYIRGLFDGDGSISSTKSGSGIEHFIWEIYGSQETCQGIANKIYEIFGFGSRNIQFRKGSSIFNYAMGGNIQIRKLYNFLYSDPNCLCLKRKKEKMAQVFNQPSRRGLEFIPMTSSEIFVTQ